MARSTEPRFEAASAISIGRRKYQEDALITDFALGADLGLVVLSDGMGGHAAGDVASKIAVTEVFSELKLQSGDIDRFEAQAPHILRDAARAANDCIGRHSKANTETSGMGATLLALSFVRDKLYWVSVGDSPLFMFKNGVLVRINADHSMAPQIDLMVALGQMSEADALHHPDRNCLTSVLCGVPIAKIDCPREPTGLAAGEIFIAASDGLQFLGDAEIQEVVRKNQKKTCAEIAAALVHELDKLGHPEQDNTALAVVRVLPVRAEVKKPAGRATPRLRFGKKQPARMDAVAARGAVGALHLAWAQVSALFAWRRAQ